MSMPFLIDTNELNALYITIVKFYQAYNLHVCHVQINFLELTRMCGVIHQVILKTLVTCNVFTQMKGYAFKQYYVYILCYFTLLCTNLSKCNFDFVMKLNNTFLACILKLFLIDSANHIDILQIAYNIYMYLYT